MFPIKAKPLIVWKSLRVTAGQAFLDRNLICLSSILIHDEARLIETLVHEYAHLLAYHRHGRKGANHGPLWQQAMADLGAKPEVRHRYTVERNQRRRAVIYRCAKCGLEFSKGRMLNKRRKYYHNNCGGQVQFMRVETTTDARVA